MMGRVGKGQMEESWNQSGPILMISLADLLATVDSDKEGDEEDDFDFEDFIKSDEDC